MSGYKQSSYEPNRWEPQGPPLRPYNWAQWTGIGFIVLGLLFEGAYFAGRAGLIPKWIDDPLPLFMFVMIGSMLVNSRRGPVRDPEGYKRRVLIALAVTLVAAVVAGFAIAILKSKGA